MKHLDKEKEEELQLLQSIVKELLLGRLDIAVLNEKIDLLTTNILQLKKEIRHRKRVTIG